MAVLRGHWEARLPHALQCDGLQQLDFWFSLYTLFPFWCKSLKEVRHKDKLLFKVPTCETGMQGIQKKFTSYAFTPGQSQQGREQLTSQIPCSLSPQAWNSCSGRVHSTLDSIQIYKKQSILKTTTTKKKNDGIITQVFCFCIAKHLNVKRYVENWVRFIFVLNGSLLLPPFYHH